MNNESSDISGLKYVPVVESKEPTEKEIRAKLFAEAKEKGLTPAKNISTEDLQNLIKD